MKRKTDNGIELHQLILKGDDLALSKLFDLYGGSVARKLKNWYQSTANADAALIYEAVNEAFLGYFRNPYTFDSRISTLERFLEVAAERDLKNILVREKKHLALKKTPIDVELHEKLWNSIAKE